VVGVSIDQVEMGSIVLKPFGTAQILELHAFRSILGAGLANHFDRNELVQSVFEQGIEDSEEEIAIAEDSGLDDDVDSDSGSIQSAKSANRSKHSKKYKDTYNY
jgi:hypothetical protein